MNEIMKAVRLHSPEEGVVNATINLDTIYRMNEYTSHAELGTVVAVLRESGVSWVVATTSTDGNTAPWADEMVNY